MQGIKIGVNNNLRLVFKMLTKQIETRTTIYNSIHTHVGSEKKQLTVKRRLFKGYKKDCSKVTKII